MSPDEDELWAVVGDPSRRHVLDLLLAHGEATPTALARDLPFTRQAVAKHLAVLDRAGLVTSRREGRETLYRVRPERLEAATRVVAQVAAQWDARLSRIKHLAEAAHRAGRGEAGVSGAAPPAASAPPPPR
jgi:ArsR family transcriptional regulator, cadmium/lead-responsive transcriptional repressor